MDRAHIVIDEYGSFLGKKSERLIVRQNGSVVAEFPLHDIEQVTVATSGASLSADVVYECAQRGIPINFLTSAGKPYAKLTSPTLLATVATRREQILAYEDERGVRLAGAFVTGKLKNQINVLRYFGKHRRKADPALFQRLQESVEDMESMASQVHTIQGQQIDEVRGTFLSLEGRAAKLYWDRVQELLDGRVDFEGREHRGADDPLNSMLNYGYGVLYNEAWGALILAGLEPFAGFLHVDRPGKPSLVLDFVEEFRQAIVDRPIMAAISKGYKPKLEENKLSRETRRDVVGWLQERLDSSQLFEGKRQRLRHILQGQARRLALFVRREGRLPTVCRGVVRVFEYSVIGFVY